MSTAAFQTFSTMIDELPIEAQETLIEKIRPIVADLIDEYRWNRTFEKSSDKLEAFAANVRQSVAKPFGKATLNSALPQNAMLKKRIVCG